MPLRAYVRGPFWWVRGTVSYKDPETGESWSRGVHETTGISAQLPKGEAHSWAVRREAAELKKLRGEYVARDEPAVARITFAEAADVWEHAARRDARDIQRIGRIAAHLGPDKLLIDCNSRSACDAIAAAICSPDATPETRRRTVHALVSSIINHAGVHWHETNKPPLRSAITVPKADTKRTDWLTPAQAELLIASAAEHLRPLLTFLVGTGARVGEAIRMEWSDVDLAAGTAIFRNQEDRRTKSGVDRRVLLPPAVVVALANLEHREGPVFRTRATKRMRKLKLVPPAFRSASGQMKTGWAGAMRRAGLVDDAGEPLMSPHSLRHSWASWFYATTRDSMWLMREGGWHSHDMVERYTHLLPLDMVPTIARVWGAVHPDEFPARVRERTERAANEAAARGPLVACSGGAPSTLPRRATPAADAALLRAGLQGRGAAGQAASTAALCSAIALAVTGARSSRTGRSAAGG